MAEQLMILDPTEEVFGKCFAHGRDEDNRIRKAVDLRSRDALHV